MNAILRDDCEAIVLTNEAIEVHLSYLRPAVEALGVRLEEVDKKIDAVEEKLDRKLDAVHEKLDSKLNVLDEKLDSKLNALDEKLDSKLNAVNEKIDSKLNAVNEKIDQRVSSIQASLDGLKWFVSSAAVLASGVSIAHSFGWI